MMTRTTIDRLAVKTLDQRFQHELETGFEIAPRVAQGILNLAKEVFGLDSGATNHYQLRPGQIRQVVAASNAVHGPPLVQTDMITVTWTIDAGEEDLTVLREHGHVALRRIRILRLIEEALEQSGVPTQEDLARALQVSVRTIRTDIAALKAAGYAAVTRGMLQGAGRGQTHKVVIVELYLKRFTYSEIMRRTHHSSQSIKRYLQSFSRVVMLTRKGLNKQEISHAVGISEKLTQEYLDLYQRYDLPEYRGRLDEMMAMISQSAANTIVVAKKGAL
jgi:transcription initiation factor IIE alpha subunit